MVARHARPDSGAGRRRGLIGAGSSVAGWRDRARLGTAANRNPGQSLYSFHHIRSWNAAGDGSPWPQRPGSRRFGGGPFTVFAPTDAAFEGALADLGFTAEELLASPELASILTCHVVAGELAASDLVAAIDAGMGSTTVDTVNGASLELTLDGGAVVVNGVATVGPADLFAHNGVVHVIDAVLLPPSE
ncbi:MAG: fasciclin domain-containing protein [Trueperaceae bacterium]